MPDARTRTNAGAAREELLDIEIGAAKVPDDLVALDEALQRLQLEDRLKHCLVTSPFAGLTIEQTSEVLDISRVTVFRYWAFARAWLLRDIRGEPRSHGKRVELLFGRGAPRLEAAH